MPTSALLPITSSTPNYDFAIATATAAQQTVFNHVLARFESAIAVGDTGTAKALLTTLKTLSPASAASSTDLGPFLNAVGKALANGNISQAQAALKSYQSTQPSTQPTPAKSTSNNATASTVAAGLIHDQLHQQLVKALLSQASDIIRSTGSSQTGSGKNSSDPLASLIDIIHTVYGTGNSSSANTSTASSTSPYDALVATLQASLNAGNGTLTPALAYLQASGNFVNTSA